MSDRLKRYFLDNQGRLIDKWEHYFDIYETHFSRFQGSRLTMVEIGVWQGGSAQMWRDYFGAGCRYIGVDIAERVLTLAEPGIEMIVGDQADRGFLRELVERVGTADIVLDDGGHTMEQQIVSFEELWPVVRDGGVYAVEDLHTSYWDEFGGGLRRDGTFIEYAKRLIDVQHAWHSRDPELEVNDLTRSIRGMHVYDSVIVFDKARVEQPFSDRIGELSFPLTED